MGRGEMNNIGSTGITAISLLTSFLMAGAASSVMLGNSDDLSENAKQMVNDVVNEITTYLKIEDAIGKYYTTDGVRSVEKIVIFVKEIIQNNINMSEVTIKISNNNDILLLKYSGHAVETDSESIFENKVWAKTNDTFSLIVIIDEDRSLLDYNIMNKDTAFIAIKLPDRFFMKNRDSLKVSIIPSNGITSSILLETPSVHISNIISFGEI